MRPFCKELAEFLDGLVSHYVLDDGKLVVAHAGMKAEMQGRGSGKVRDFALYGETTGETDEFGLPVRYNWAAEYRGPAMVVYGHTPVPEPEWLNRTVNIDTGCVFGGKLTALRYPEKEFVSVPAARTYCEPARPFLPAEQQAPKLTAQQAHDDVLDAEDVLGKRIVPTRLRGNVTIREANATAALEVMSRFAADPKWLIYLPPTMSPCETSSEPGLLEHPAEAFAYYRSQGAPQVDLRGEAHGVAGRRDRLPGRAGGQGAVRRHRGRGRHRQHPHRPAVLQRPGLEAQFLDRVRAALTAADFWSELETTWACLDCELMPWSAKAQELLKTQYAAVGAAGPGLAATGGRFPGAGRRAAGRRREGQGRAGRWAIADAGTEHIGQFVAAYRQYCWPVDVADRPEAGPVPPAGHRGARPHGQEPRLAHGHAGEGLPGRPRTAAGDRYKVVDVTDPASEAEGVAWWTELTGRGGEGMVVKPLDFILRGKRGLAQPAVKCRGREYLRIIYGPDYTAEENLSRLRNRGLGHKRSLALGEFALGVEGLERFVRREPLRRVHECVFGVLALESEPVDPRL